MSDSRDYKYLYVMLEIYANKCARFEELMGTLKRDAFEAPPRAGEADSGLGWTLLRASKKPVERGNELVVYCHLWRLPRESLLQDAMVKLGRNRSYYELELCKKSEAQELLTESAVYSPPHDNDLPMLQPSGAGDTIAVETVDIPGEWFQLHDWQENMPVIASELVGKGMKLLLALQPETGSLRRRYNIWSVPKEGSESALRDNIKGKTYPALPGTVAKGPAGVRSGTPAGGRSLIDYPNSSFQLYREVIYR
jgi:hypothetical protein